MARQVELALTRRDHLGNVLTPKQGFRELCYRSGPAPSALSGFINLKRLLWSLRQATSDSTHLFGHLRPLVVLTQFLVQQCF